MHQILMPDADWRAPTRAGERYDEAEKAYKKAIGLKPSYWGGHLDLGSFYYFRKRYAEAS